MLNSDFWQNTANEFRALDPAGANLKAHWIYDIDDNDVPCSKATWAITQSDGLKSVEVSFVSLASRAAIRLFPAHAGTRLSVDMWLDAVKEHRRAKISSDGNGMSLGKRTRWGRGIIDDICVASADFCKALEASELDKERLRAIPQEPLTNDPLESVLGTDLGSGFDANTQTKIRAELLIVIGRKAQGLYPTGQPYKHLFDAYQRVARAIVNADTTDEVLSVILPNIVDNCRIVNFWPPQIDSRECIRLLVQGPVAEWLGLRDRMGGQRRKSKSKTPQEQRAEIIRAQQPDLKTHAEIEAQRQFAIEQKLEELRFKARSVHLTKGDASQLAATQAKFRRKTRTPVKPGKAKTPKPSEIRANEPRAVAAAYFEKFPEKIAIVEACWAAGQHYREWKRWIAGTCKPGSKPDRAFRAILTSGKRPSEYKAQSRPPKWT